MTTPGKCRDNAQTMVAPGEQYSPFTQDRVRAVIGDDLTDKLQSELGGSEVYFAENPTHDSPAVLCIGVDAVRMVARQVGRGHCIIALGRFSARERSRADARGLLRQGMPAGRVARETGLHLRTIQRIRAEMKARRPGARP